MWGVAMSALTIVVALAVARGVMTSLLLVIPFVASTTARRFGVTPMDASIDKEGLWLGDTLVGPRGDILDAWADPDDTDHRVSVAVKPDELLIIHLPNAAQAKRFARELTPANANANADAAVAVAGYRPRPIDAVYPVRLLAVIGAFIASAGWKNPAAALLLVFFALGAYGFVIGTQIQSGPDGLHLKSFARERHLPWSDVTEAVLDRLHARIVRSRLLTTSAWTKKAHARVIAHAKGEMKKRREG